MTAKRRLVTYCATYLAALWLVAIIPFVSVLVEYGGIPLCPGVSLGWFIATLYSPFFIWPISIGVLSMAALVLPLATALSLTRAHHTTYFFAGFYILTMIVIAALEFSTPAALFQVPPQAIAANAQFLKGLTDACNQQPFQAYQQQLTTLIAAGRSFTSWLYYPGFIAQTLMQNALFVVFLVFVFYPKREIVQRAPYLPDTMAFVLGYAMFLGSIWCLFRLTYRHDMLDLLNTSNPFFGDYAIIILYAVALAVFVAYFQFNLDQLAKTITQISQFLVFVGGVAFVQFKPADKFLGTQASITNIFALFLLFIFISALTLAFLLRSSKRGR